MTQPAKPVSDAADAITLRINASRDSCPEYAAELMREAADTIEELQRRIKAFFDSYPPFFPGESRAACVECHDLIAAELAKELTVEGE